MSAKEPTESDKLSAFLLQEFLPELRGVRKDTQDLKIELARTQAMLKGYDRLVENVNDIKASVQAIPAMQRDVEALRVDVDEHTKAITAIQTKTDYRKAVRETRRVQIGIWIAALALAARLLVTVPWHNIKLL